MREKLIEYVRSLFRNAPNNPHNEELEAEILQNSLDRFDDLVSKGVSEESAYSQAVESIGDVRQLWEQENQPQVKQQEPKRRIGKKVGLICAAAALLIVAGLFAGWVLEEVSFDNDRRGADWDDRIEGWAEGIEENVEQWVDAIDEEYGYSVIVPNSSISYTDSERYQVGPTELQSDVLTQLSIGWMAGEVTVEVWDGDTISISETGAEEEQTQLRWLLEDGELDINYCAAGTHKTLPRKELTVRIPEALAGQLRSLHISGVSQDMTVTGLTASQVGIYSTSGALAFTGSAEQLRLETTSGNMKVELEQVPDGMEFDSVSGSLTVTIPGGRCFEVDWETVSGDFDCAFEGKRSDDEWLFNTEENYYIRGEFDFDTVSGDVTIRERS